MPESQHQRLLEAADAFFYVGILSSRPFNAAAVIFGDHRNAGDAAAAATTGKDLDSVIAAPIIVNFALSVELYFKFILALKGGTSPRHHELKELFHILEERAPEIAQAVTDHHAYARGRRHVFVEALAEHSKAFVEWRYAHEKELLVTSADSLMLLADACRRAIRETFPHIRSAFDRAR